MQCSCYKDPEVTDIVNHNRLIGQDIFVFCGHGQRFREYLLSVCTLSRDERVNRDGSITIVEDQVASKVRDAWKLTLL